MSGSTRREMRTNWQAEAGAGPGDTPTGWTAYLVFAGVMLAVVGLFHAMAGVTALVNSDALQAGTADLVVDVDFTVWGWVHIVVGVASIVTGFLLLRGDTIGRVLAIVVCGTSALVNLLFIAALPAWSVVAIAFDVLVIYAVTVHGDAVPTDR